MKNLVFCLILMQITKSSIDLENFHDLGLGKTNGHFWEAELTLFSFIMFEGDDPPQYTWVEYSISFVLRNSSCNQVELSTVQGATVDWTKSSQSLYSSGPPDLCPISLVVLNMKNKLFQWSNVIGWKWSHFTHETHMHRIWLSWRPGSIESTFQQQKLLSLWSKLYRNSDEIKTFSRLSAINGSGALVRPTVLGGALR